MKLFKELYQDIKKIKRTKKIPIKEILKFTLFLGFFGLFFLILPFINEQSIGSKTYYYNAGMFLILIISLWYIYFYCSVKNNNLVLDIILIFILGVCFLGYSPIIFVISIVNRLGIRFNKKAVAKNFVALILELILYLVGYAYCLNLSLNYELVNFNFILYIGYQIVIFVVIYIIRKLIRRYFIEDSNLQRYLYNKEIEKIYTYCSIILSVIVGIIGESSDISYRYFIIPFIVFSGMEQIIILPKKNRKDYFVEYINSILDELLILQDYLVTVIEDYSCMNIKLRLDYISYMPDILFQKRKRTDRFYVNKLKRIQDLKKTLHNTSIMLDKITKRKYCCFDEDIKMQINKDIDETLELVAKCLLLDEKIKR